VNLVSDDKFGSYSPEGLFRILFYVFPPEALLLRHCECDVSGILLRSLEHHVRACTKPLDALLRFHKRVVFDA
jgi:hypothetical protein